MRAWFRWWIAKRKAHVAGVRYARQCIDPASSYAEQLRRQCRGVVDSVRQLFERLDGALRRQQAKLEETLRHLGEAETDLKVSESTSKRRLDELRYEAPAWSDRWIWLVTALALIVEFPLAVNAARRFATGIPEYVVWLIALAWTVILIVLAKFAGGFWKRGHVGHSVLLMLPAVALIVVPMALLREAVATEHAQGGFGTFWLALGIPVVFMLVGWVVGFHSSPDSDEYLRRNRLWRADHAALTHVQNQIYSRECDLRQLKEKRVEAQKRHFVQACLQCNHWNELYQVFQGAYKLTARDDCQYKRAATDPSLAVVIPDALVPPDEKRTAPSALTENE